MSSISSLSPLGFRLAAEPDPTISVARSEASNEAPATLAAAAAIDDLFASLGLAGLRPPGAAGASGIALAEIALALERTTGNARGQRAALQAAAGGLAAGALSPASAFARAEANRTVVAGKEQEKTAKQAEWTVVKAQADALDAAIAAQAKAVEAAEKAVAAATTDEARAAAAAQLSAARGTLDNLETRRAALDVTLADISLSIGILTDAIADLRKTIANDMSLGTQLATMAQIVAMATVASGRGREQVQSLTTAGAAIQLDTLFEAITRTIAAGEKAARGVAEASDTADGEASEPPPPPPRVELAAAVVRDAVLDLLDALAEIDPNAIARPPEQTGRPRLRLDA